MDSRYCGGKTYPVPDQDAQEGDPHMGPSLVQWLETHSVTRAQLARDLGVSPGAVKNWANGHGLSSTNRRRLAEYMERRTHESSDRPTPDEPSGHSPGAEQPQQVGSRLLSASSTDDQMVMTRPEGVSDAEWAEFRAGTWEAYARWLASRAQAAARALERHTGTSLPSS